MIVPEWNRRNICEDLNENELWINVDSLIYAADSGLSSSGITLRQTNLTTVIVTKLAYSIFLSPPSPPFIIRIYPYTLSVSKDNLSFEQTCNTPPPTKHLQVAYVSTERGEGRGEEGGILHIWGMYIFANKWNAITHRHGHAYTCSNALYTRPISPLLPIECTVAVRGTRRARNSVHSRGIPFLRCTPPPLDDIETASRYNPPRTDAYVCVYYAYPGGMRIYIHVKRYRAGDNLIIPSSNFPS